MNNYSRVIVADYMHHRLRRNGMQWPNSCPVDLPTSPGRVERAMRSLGEEFEERYQQVFNEMCQQLHITPNNAEATFATIVGELFSDGIKWGRIVALFSFGGCLAVECVQKEMPNLVDQVLEWTTRYVDLNLMPWIQQNGGWVRNSFKSTLFCECSNFFYHLLQILHFLHLSLIHSS